MSEGARDRGLCPTCQAVIRVRDDGTPHHNHACWMKWSGEPAPWPFMWPTEAGRLLGVDPEALEGIAGRTDSLRSTRLVKAKDCRVPNAHSRNAYNSDDIAALVALTRPHP